MRYRSNVLAFMAALAMMLTADIQAQTTNPPYLAQFPSPERIKADVRGVDAMETAAKQAGIFWQLRQLISLLAYSQRRTERQFTPDEQRLEPVYRNAYYYAMEPFEGKVTGADKLRWYELHSKYEFDLWLRDEVFKKYFTPELRRAVYVALKGEVPTRNAPDGSTLAPTAAEIAANKAKSVGSPSQPNAQPSTPAGGSVENYIAQGHQYRQAKNYAAAVEAYKKANSLQPSIGAYSGLGVVYLELKQYENALATFQQAVRLKPDDATMRSNVGVAYFWMEQYENAIGTFREALRLKPDYAGAYNLLGNAYCGLEQYPEAVAAYQQAIRLEPNNADFLQNLGTAYVDMRRKAEALQIHQKLQKIDPAEAKELKDIIELYLDKDDPLWFESMADEAFGRDDYVSVLRAYHHFIALKPADPVVLATAHNGRGHAFVELKKYEKAIAEYREAVRLDPKEPGYHLNIGRTYLAMGQKDQALQVYRTLQRLDREKALKLYAEINKSK